MKPLFDISILKRSKSNIKFPFECEFCKKIFYIEAKFIKSIIKRKLNEIRFCSLQCKNTEQKKTKQIKCVNCNKQFEIKRSEIKKSKSGNSFCSQSCAAIYNNTHRTTGCRRSKLEKWLEEQLPKHYPNLTILYNDKTIINSELDIYVPSLKLAFELNGIFHYEPIHGVEKLAMIKNNDDRKFQACLEQNIELVIIDASKEAYFKLEKSQKYLDIIKNIIDMKLNSTS